MVTCSFQSLDGKINIEIIIIIILLLLLLLLLLEFLGETRVIRIIIQLIIIRAGTPHVGHSFSFNWKTKCIDFKIDYILDSS